MRRTKVARVLLVGAVLAWPLPAVAQRGDCRGARPSGWSAPMVEAEEPGEPLLVTGRVLDLETGAPLAAVEILAYQTDASGLYSRAGSNESEARLCAVVRSDELGRYRFETILPGAYPSGRVPRHIHFLVSGAGIERQQLDLQFAADYLDAEGALAEEPTWARIRPVEAGTDGRLAVVKDLRVRAAAPTQAP